MMKVDKTIYDGLSAVSELGDFNRYNVELMTLMARQMGYGDTADWISENPTQYHQGLLQGFVVADQWQMPDGQVLKVGQGVVATSTQPFTKGQVAEGDIAKVVEIATHHVVLDFSKVVQVLPKKVFSKYVKVRKGQ